MKKVRYIFGGALTAILLYFLLWPVAVEPQAWQAPENPGYSGPFAVNQRLADLEMLEISGYHGPEDIALDSLGRIYAATHEGSIIRLDADGLNPQSWVNTGGRPLGIAFDGDGNLIVADSYRGLLSVNPDGKVVSLTKSAGGIEINYANNVDIAADGRIYFSDASTKFGAKQFGGTYPASLLDINEHGGHGRLLRYDPASGTTAILLSGLNFANGVALSPDDAFVLLAETGSYRIIKYWLSGEKSGQHETLIASLPGFPDNLTTGLDGRFWAALVSPRNALIDRLSGSPFWRRIIQRLPGFIRPKAVAYGHIFAFEGDGRIVDNYQDPAGGYPLTTCVAESPTHLYIGSLVAPQLGRLAKTPSQTGFQNE